MTENILLLAGRVAVITGGLGDIGFAVAEVLAENGATVAIADIHSADVAAQKIGSHPFRYTQVDVADSKEVDDWFSEVSDSLGTPTLVVANAGLVEIGFGLRISPESWQRTMDVSLNGAFFTATSGGRRMVDQKLEGRIVLMGSWAAENVHADLTAYSVSKAALRMMGKCLALELAPKGVLLNEVAPGFVNAGLTGKFYEKDPEEREKGRRLVPVRRLISARDVALQVLHLCHPDNVHMSGSTLLMDGGLSLMTGREDVAPEDA
ncbi:MAG: SDR family oxidoreductase [Opitutaceae bacterium]|nr:SDR family oxidoreductase [Opitutaceae bacterium]